MGDKPENKKGWQQYLSVLFFLVLGAICGIFIAKYIDTVSSMGLSGGVKLLLFLSLLLVLYIAVFIQIIIHEVGHLIFALLTGYKFSSFRILSFMWIKEKGKVRFRRYSLAGTGGQVLMAPPDMVEGKLPVVLYNLGGSILNTITGVLFIFLYFQVKHMLFLSTVMLFLAVSGIIFALLNGIPMRLGIIDNDGYNAFSLSKDEKALRSFWVQLKANEMLANGVRLKDMPDDWFWVPTDEEMKNSMVAVMGVYVCNRRMDAHKFDEGNQLMEHLLEIDSSIVGLHRSLLICDRIYYELINNSSKETVDTMITEEQKKFMKAMRKFPTVIRMEYVYALLAEKDIKKAKEIKDQFLKYTRNYPYPIEIEAELELMRIAEEGIEKEL